MRAADLVTAALLMLLGGVVLYDAARLGIGWGIGGPGSGFFPFWLAVLLVTIGAVVCLQALLWGSRHPFVTRERFTPVLKVVVPLAGLVVALSIAVPVITFLIFETWFLVPMPKGPVEAWLGY
ncbi:MAG: hypothetical protein HYU47_15510 [Deltaproteobacteria bacterium]|nr:hypothetical protein [Deltaproteobacteria bacterium]